MPRYILPALTALFLVACGPEESGSTGDPPAISDLALTPDTIGAGTPVRLDGHVNFEDPDADVRFLAVELRAAGGIVQRLPDVAVSGTGAAGRVDFQLLLQVPSPMEVTVAVWLVDGQENESNALEANVVVQ